MSCFDVEEYIYNRALHIDSIYNINFISAIKPTLIYIKNIKHCIILFPDRTIFNCNPNDCQLCKVTKLKTDGIFNYQIEPELEVYERYWDAALDAPYFENDQNCVLWSGYYLDWYINHKDGDLFSASLLDLEIWCKTYYENVIKKGL